MTAHTDVLRSTKGRAIQKAVITAQAACRPLTPMESGSMLYHSLDNIRSLVDELVNDLDAGARPALILPCSDGEYVVTNQMLAVLEEIRSEINVSEELEKMREWLIITASEHKTRDEIRRQIYDWLGHAVRLKDQSNQGGRQWC